MVILQKLGCPQGGFLCSCLSGRVATAFLLPQDALSCLTVRVALFTLALHLLQSGLVPFSLYSPAVTVHVSCCPREAAPPANAYRASKLSSALCQQAQLYDHCHTYITTATAFTTDLSGLTTSLRPSHVDP